MSKTLQATEIDLAKLEELFQLEKSWDTEQATYSLEVGMPQALTHMIANSHPERPVFGLVTNESEFIFLKLQQQDTLKYAESDLFSLKRGNDLYTVVSILKHLSQLVAKP
jgi:hypothetical protein